MTRAVGELIQFDTEWNGKPWHSVWRVVHVDGDTVTVRHHAGAMYVDEVRLTDRSRREGVLL